MTPRSSVALAFLIVVALLAPMAGASHAYTHTKSYVGTVGAAPLNCDGHIDQAIDRDLANAGVETPTQVNQHVPDNLGGACFRVMAGATHDVRVVDASGLTVAAMVTVFDGDGRVLLTQGVCGRGYVTTPAGGHNLQVGTLAPGLAQVACGIGAVAGAPTTGTISVSW